MNDLATHPITADEPTIPIPTVPPNTPTRNNERQRTPYERIQRRLKNRAANKADREETERFFDEAIGLAEDERTEMAKATDNLCPFKQAVHENDVLQPRRQPSNSISIIQGAKNIGYSINRAFRKANIFVKEGFDSKSVRIRHDVMLATYNDREVPAPSEFCTCRRQFFARR